MALTATTELNAVNIMLGTIGESPIATLEVTGLADVATARNILEEVSRAVQSTGWHFNTETEYPLALDSNGYLPIPSNTLSVDSSDSCMTSDVVRRGLRLYDRTNHTYVFTAPIKVDLVVFLPYEELPEAARHYIAIRAARVFQRRILGSDVLDQFSAEDESAAWRNLQDAEMKSADTNIFNSYAAARVLRR
jgi:hypothetical protein